MPPTTKAGSLSERSRILVVLNRYVSTVADIYDSSYCIFCLSPTNLNCSKRRPALASRSDTSNAAVASATSADSRIACEFIQIEIANPANPSALMNTPTAFQLMGPNFVIASLHCQ